MNRILRTISFVAGIISIASFAILMFVNFEKLVRTVISVADKSTKKIKLPAFFDFFN